MDLCVFVLVNSLTVVRQKSQLAGLQPHLSKVEPTWLLLVRHLVTSRTRGLSAARWHLRGTPSARELRKIKQNSVNACAEGLAEGRACWHRKTEPHSAGHPLEPTPVFTIQLRARVTANTPRALALAAMSGCYHAGNEKSAGNKD